MYRGQIVELNRGMNKGRAYHIIMPEVRNNIITGYYILAIDYDLTATCHRTTDELSGHSEPVCWVEPDGFDIITD